VIKAIQNERQVNRLDDEAGRATGSFEQIMAEIHAATAGS
jgi:hypothetical protein